MSILACSCKEARSPASTSLAANTSTTVAPRLLVSADRRHMVGAASRGDSATLLGLLILMPMIALALLAPVLPLPDANVPDVRSALEAALNVASARDGQARTRHLCPSGHGCSYIAPHWLHGGDYLGGRGMLLGMLSSTLGRAVDGTIMAVVDLLLSFPSLLLAIGFVAVFGAGVVQTIVAIALADVPRAIRLQRSLALGIPGPRLHGRGSNVQCPDVVDHRPSPAAEHVGADAGGREHLCCECHPRGGGAELPRAGITPPTPSWGNIISDGRKYLQDAWWITALSGIGHRSRRGQPAPTGRRHAPHPGPAGGGLTMWADGADGVLLRARPAGALPHE